MHAANSPGVWTEVCHSEEPTLRLSILWSQGSKAFPKTPEKCKTVSVHSLPGKAAGVGLQLV
jgi:hypothetical protein